MPASGLRRPILASPRSLTLSSLVLTLAFHRVHCTIRRRDERFHVVSVEGIYSDPYADGNSRSIAIFRDAGTDSARYRVRSFPPGFWKQKREFISSEPRGGIYISAK